MDFLLNAIVPPAELLIKPIFKESAVFIKLSMAAVKSFLWSGE